MKLSLDVNGRPISTEIDPAILLSDFLRENLNLTGTHVGCDTSQCGACVVHVDGQSVKSCTMLAVSTEGRAVTTIEGVAKNGKLHPMQQAFHENHGLQCGFCTPGMIMSALELIKRNPKPTESDVRHWLEGNICRCTGYQNIVASVIAGAAAIQAEGGR
jgi:carbon-monoxide dehydrogenase small subunit